MNASTDNSGELAALHALGALDGPDVKIFEQRLAAAAARDEAKAFERVTEALAKSLPSSKPCPELKQRILAQVQQRKQKALLMARLRQFTPKANEGMAFVKQADASGWLPMQVPGAFVKLLSFDPESNYAVVLGKLEAGAKYPSHQHLHPEDIYMLSGDLHIGDEMITTGDFHHAEAGSTHGVNWSENGCILLAILTKDDLLAQFATA